jgi:hypothetical protein
VVALVNVAVFGARKRNEDACESSGVKRGGPTFLCFRDVWIKEALF